MSKGAEGFWLGAKHFLLAVCIYVVAEAGGVGGFEALAVVAFVVAMAPDDNRRARGRLASPEPPTEAPDVPETPSPPPYLGSGNVR